MVESGDATFVVDAAFILLDQKTTAKIENKKRQNTVIHVLESVAMRDVCLYVASEYLEGLDLLSLCAVCVGWRNVLVAKWALWRHRLRQDYGLVRRAKQWTADGQTIRLSWRDTYLSKVNEEAKSCRKHYYLFYFNMFHAWYDDFGERQSEMRREHIVAFCKKRRGLFRMRRVMRYYIDMEGGTYDDSAWQGMNIERVQFPSFRSQFQVRKGNKTAISIGGVMVRY